ncbi:MAG: AI-2E family transporter [Thermomicrobiales bacterium]
MVTTSASTSASNMSNPVGRVNANGPDHEDPGSRRRSGLTPVSLFLVLLMFWIVTQIQIVLVLGLLALLIGTILDGPISWLEKRHVPRPAAIAMIYAVIIGGIVLLVVAIIPVVGSQADTFRQEVPAKIEQLRQDWLKSSNPILNGVGADALKQGQDFLDKPATGVSPDTAQRVLPFVVSIGTGLVSAISLLVITFYYLLEKSLIRELIIAKIPERSQKRVNRIWGDVESKVGGWMRGQLLLCFIIGALATISYGIIALPFWPLLGLWAGVTEILPIVGPWIGGVPAVILAMTVGWDKAIITAAIIIGMQSLENWFLVPRVMRGAVGLSPLAVFLAILAGQQFMGFVGAVLAIPIAAAIQVILTDWLNSRRDADEPPPISGWRWMLARATARDDAIPDKVLESDDQQIVSDLTVPTLHENPGTHASSSASASDPAAGSPESPPVTTGAPEDETGNPWQWHQRGGVDVSPPKSTRSSMKATRKPTAKGSKRSDA